MQKRNTRLERLSAEDSVVAILNSKLAEGKTSDQIADYISFSVDGLTADIERAEEAIDELKYYIKQSKATIEDIKIGTAEWLTDAGIDRIDGMRVSSITTYNPKPSEEIVILDEMFWIESGYIKISVDKTAVKNFLLSFGEKIEEKYKDKAVIETMHKQQTVKINKKRAKKDDLSISLDLQGKQLNYNGEDKGIIE